MSTLTTINSGDLITNSRTDINNNFSALNNEKIETSYLSTDNTLSENSDTKIATQKAVKAYVDAGGNVNASETTKGIVEEATDAEVTAGTATGATGAKLFVTPAKYKTNIDSRVSAFTFLKGIKGGISAHNMATTGAETIAHGLGVTPVFIRICAYGVLTSDGYSISSSIGCYDGTTNSFIAYQAREGGSSAVNDSTASGTGNIIYLYDTNNVSAVATFDATNITLTWSKSVSPTGTVQIAWEAYS